MAHPALVGGDGEFARQVVVGHGHVPAEGADFEVAGRGVRRTACNVEGERVFLRVDGDNLEPSIVLRLVGAADAYPLAGREIAVARGQRGRGRVAAA